MGDMLRDVMMDNDPARLIDQLRSLADGGRVAEIMERLVIALKRARAIHPDYCCGPYEALGNLEAEVGEVAREIVKGQQGWQERADQEVVDVITVALRYLLGEHVKEDCQVDGLHGGASWDA